MRAKERAQKLMAQNELIWDDEGLSGAERASRRQEWAERYRKSIEAGKLYYAYVDYPYIEWYSDNGRCVLELEPTQAEVIGGSESEHEQKSPEALVSERKRREKALLSHLAQLTKQLSEQNRKHGGDGNVFGGLVLG